MEIDREIYKILVVEDNDGDFLLLQDYFEERILTPYLSRATTLKEAQKLFFSPEANFDVIFLDLSLANLDQHELISEARSLAEVVPVIMLTSYSELKWAIKALSAGFSDYLLKDELSSVMLYRSLRYNIERNRYIKTIQFSEKKYSDLFQMSPLPMWVFDVKSLRFLDVNEAAVRHYGYTKKQFLSMTIKDIRPKEDISILEGVLEESTKKTTDFYYKGVFRHLLRNGELIYVNLQSNLINFDGKRAKIVLAHDITERIVYTKTIEEQNERLKDIAWLQSHSVRAPLARIIGLIHVLASRKLDSGKEQIYLNYVLDSAHELDAIINEVVEKTRNINLKDKNE